MANEKMREKARKCGVRFWQIADALGVSEATLTRRFRHELPAGEQARIARLIDELHKSEG